VEDIFKALAADFQDWPSLAEAVRMAVRLLIASILGGILGFQREKAGKAAGLRTHILVSLGAALFVIIPQQLGMTNADLSRIIQGIVAGIGFLGAGAIAKKSSADDIDGLTTAAGIWLTAAIGIGAGLGREASAILGAAMALIVLSTLHQLSRQIRKSA
jgi:putative Mg2+ transporter-C (MgtC) family protein